MLCNQLSFGGFAKFHANKRNAQISAMTDGYISLFISCYFRYTCSICRLLCLSEHKNSLRFEISLDRIASEVHFAGHSQVLSETQPNITSTCFLHPSAFPLSHITSKYARTEKRIRNASQAV